MSENDLSAFTSALVLPSVCLSATGQIAAYNPAFQALYPAAQQGRPAGLVLRRPEILQAIDAAQPGQPQSVEITATLGARDLRWKVTAAVFETADARWTLVSFEDRTEAAQSAQQRRDFVANVSHELRSPLTALTGLIETLHTTARDDSDARDRFLKIMEREAHRMSRLIQDLLSLSRVEANERRRPTERVDLAALVSSVLSLIEPSAKTANVALHSHGLNDPMDLPGDPDQLRQVFTNLIENAVKYGAGGGRVDVRAHRVPHDAALRAPAIRIDVADYGDGFDPIHIRRLTERFYRIDDHRSREKGGTGLGLAIVKHIVNRHRGRLEISSTPGKGSTFSVLLPVPPHTSGDHS